jgi:2-C-methyl-D-erythritol 4-phosphate cytidylyltransferase
MSEEVKIYAIIVAGGSGKRMGSSIPKQFLLLDGKPVLMHTISRFVAAYPEVECIVVLPESQIEFWRKLCRDYQFTLKHHIAIGGETRFDSVKNGLAALPALAGVVAIHDAVRPFASSQLIRACISQAQHSANAVPALPCVDSVREIDEHGVSKIVNREKLRMVQTPQCFSVAQIVEAYAKASGSHFTDDASVYEANGGTIILIDGEAHNIKITNPFDLELGKLIIQQQE